MEYTHLTTPPVLQQSYTLFGKASPKKLAKVDKKMNVKCDLLPPIENLVEQIKTTIHIAGSSSTPYNAAQILSTTCNLIHKTGVYKNM